MNKMKNLSQKILVSIAFTCIHSIFNPYAADLIAASSREQSEDLSKIDSFLETYQPHQIYVQNQTEADIQLSIFLKNETVPGDNTIVSWDASIPSSQVEKIIGTPISSGHKIRVRNHGAQSFYYPSSNTINIPSGNTLKYSAPDEAFMTGLMSEYRGSANIFRSGNHWVINFSESPSQPFYERDIIRPYFSLEYYNATYGLDFTLEEAMSHYLNQGVKLGYNPNEWFNSEKYQHYFETEINPLIDFLLQRQVCIEKEERILEIKQDTSVEDSLFTLIYQLRYKVLPKQIALKTPEILPPHLLQALEEKGILVNSSSLIPTETISGSFIEDRAPWFKKYRRIQARDIVGKAFTFGAFEHNESGPYIQRFAQFTFTEGGRIYPSPHENEVNYRFTNNNHLEILDYKGEVTSLFIVKKESNSGYFGLLGKFMPDRQRHHFLCTTDNDTHISDLFSDFMVDTPSRFDIFYHPELVQCDYTYNNEFEERARSVFDHDNDSLKYHHNHMLKRSEELLASKRKLPASERIEKISHNLWLTNLERPSYPNSALIELCSAQLGKMDLINNFRHFIWTNTPLETLERELHLRNIDYERKAPEEAFEKASIKAVCDNLVTNKLFGIAVNPLKFSILEKFGGIVLDLGVVLKPKYYELLSQFSFIGSNVPEWKWGLDIYCLAAKSHHPIYKKMVNLISNLDSLTTAQRSVIKYSALGDVCWIGQMVTYYLDGFKQETPTMLADFGSCVWTQRSRTWLNGTSGNSVIRFEPRHQLEGKTVLPIFSQTIEEKITEENSVSENI